MGADRADSDSTDDPYHCYEIAGASHMNQWALSLSPNPEDMVKAGIAKPPPNCNEFATYGVTDFPLEYFMSGAFANLDAWVRSKTVPPRVPRIQLEPAPKDSTPSWPPTVHVKLDKYGNAVGGLRSPYVDVPTGTYHVYSTPANPNSPDCVLFCSLVGYKVSFNKALLKELYPTHEGYVKKVNSQVDKMVKDRLITKFHGQKIREEAAKAAIP